MEAFIKRRIPGKTTCSNTPQYNSNTVVIKYESYIKRYIIQSVLYYIILYYIMRTLTNI